MPEKHLLPVAVGENGELVSELCSPERKLQHFGNVVASVMRDAHNVWSDMWEELRNCVTEGGMVISGAKKEFKPECGWPEFLEKMWLLRHYLDYTRRLCAKQR
jgi:hypothetical protein